MDSKGSQQRRRGGGDKDGGATTTRGNVTITELPASPTEKQKTTKMTTPPMVVKAKSSKLTKQEPPACHLRLDGLSSSPTTSSSGDTGVETPPEEEEEVEVESRGGYTMDEESEMADPKRKTKPHLNPNPKLNSENAVADAHAKSTSAMDSLLVRRAAASSVRQRMIADRARRLMRDSDDD